MPPIAGVANGAMVLRDGAFNTANLDDFQAGLRPKIQGTINLDRLFSETTNEPLDWFIGFSSLAAVIGNPGQSAYSAGNGCMRAVVNGRRCRGLAGSVIHISRITGIGYIERELTKDSQERLKVRSGTLAMSENDLHHLFAEGIVAGRPTSGMNPELITGLGLHDRASQRSLLEPEREDGFIDQRGGTRRYCPRRRQGEQYSGPNIVGSS
jgi:hypothetical protein